MFAVPTAPGTLESLQTANPKMESPPMYATELCGEKTTPLNGVPLVAVKSVLNPVLGEYSYTLVPLVKYALLLSLAKSAAVTLGISNSCEALAVVSKTNTLPAEVSDMTTLLPLLETLRTLPVKPLAVAVTVFVPGSKTSKPASLPI